MKDFFVSYNRADRSWAEWIAWHLEEEGFTTVLQAWDFRPGTNFVEEMDRATIQADRTIAVLSPDYLASRFTKAEWQAAFRRDPTGEAGTLLPVRVRESERTGLMASIVYVDLVGQDEDAAREALLAGVDQTRAKPSSAPPFPGAPALPAAERTVPEHPPFPAPPQAIFNVPQSRNPDFTGREELLQAMARALASDTETTVLQAVHGMGGVGKTQTAIEYAYRHREDYAVVWWVRAEDASSLATDYAALASELQLAVAEISGLPETIDAVRAWLAQADRPWLLVFDNVGKFEDITDYLPRYGRGHVLVTSRSRDWPRTVQRQEVDVMPEDEAVAFLARRTGRDDAAGARELAAAVGALPLALEQAAAYIDARGIGFAAYLERFRTYREDLLERGKPSDYPFTVGTTWKLSFEAAVAQAPAAEALMNLLAFMAPDAIPLDLLAAQADVLPAPLAEAMGDVVALDGAVMALRQYSLVKVVDEQTLGVHRLVQDVVRDRLDDEAARTWATAAVELVTATLPDDPRDPRSWPAYARLVTHVEAVAGHVQQAAGDLATTAVLLNQLGGYLRTQALNSQAWTAAERALAIQERVLPGDHPETALSLNVLGLVLLNQGDLDGARTYLEHALTIYEQVHGLDHPEVAITLSDLGLVLQDQGDLTGARAHLERALAIHEHRPGHPEVASTLNVLGSVLLNLGDLAGARKYLERALEIKATIHEPNHPEVATTLNTLGTVLLDQGDLAGASAHFGRALEIRERALPGDHPDIVRSLNKLAGVLLALRDPAGARLLWEFLLMVQHQPVSHAEGATFFQLGQLAAALDRPDAGLRLLATAYIIDRQLGHPDAEAADLPAVQREADALGLDPARLDALLAEVEEAYRKDRGRSLVAAAFPELDIDS